MLLLLSVLLGAPALAAEPAPSLNARFVDPELKVDEWVKRFEAESREVVAQQPQILAAVGVKAGEHVADVGAGTGLYVGPFAEAVGDAGKVYAVDISPRFLDHLRKGFAKHDNVAVVEGGPGTVPVPAGTLDAVFVCDTYHHFEQVPEMLASMHAALKPGGRLVVVDFDRIEGTSSDWILKHVRADKATFRSEIEKAGFTFDAEVDAGLKDNYLLRFTR